MKYINNYKQFENLSDKPNFDTERHEWLWSTIAAVSKVKWNIRNCAEKIAWANEKLEEGQITLKFPY